MRGKRRKRYTWFPTNFQTYSTSDEASLERNIQGISFLDMETNGANPHFAISPLVLSDSPRESDVGDSFTLNDIVGNEYIVKRIVGKFHAGAWIDTSVDFAPNIAGQLTFGIFVARADTDAPSVPLGADGSAAEAYTSFNPQAVETEREPWMFQRTWIMGCMNDTGTLGLAVSPKGAGFSRAFPTSTGAFGSLHAGPHIDIKTARRVGADERLYAAVSWEKWPRIDGENNLTYSIRCDAHFSYRVLGAIRKAKGKSNF